MSVEKQAADDLLDKGGRRFKIGKRSYSIKKLKAGTMLSISAQVCSMKELSSDKSLLQNLIENSGNVKQHCNIIALSILNSFFKNWMYRPFAYYLRWKLDNAEIGQLMRIVAEQLNAQDFFFTMTLTKGMNLMRKMEEDGKEGKPSTEP